MRVGDLPGARKPVMTVAPGLVIEEVARQMRTARVGALVVSADGEKIEGIITERDIVFAVGIAGAAVLHRTAAQLMSCPVRTCAPGDRLVEVMRMMSQNHIRHVPLCDKGKLSGMVSMGDVMASRLADIELEATVLREINLSHS
jgi:signal-transduction protein with cAMP-binding, CBS, and nucleotidyltransferase domain